MSEYRISNVDEFLKLYRSLELELNRRYAGKNKGGSVVMTYLGDPDSIPFRTELDVCREIRNLLSHNVDMYGSNVVEPSHGILQSLKRIVEHVAAPQYAIHFGTPLEKIFCASMNDSVLNVMREMERRGFSHVPVLENGKVMGVFGPGCLFAHQARKGLISLSNGARMYQIKDELRIDRNGEQWYLFMPKEATIVQVRAAFDKRIERNQRLRAVFITENGRSDDPLLAMLTPWDALKDSANAE